MYVQYGGALPVYTGTRYQRGGGILSSFARFALPMAKKMLMETFKAAPGVVDAIISKKAAPGTAILQGLKRAGVNTARQTFNNVDFEPTRPIAKRAATSRGRGRGRGRGQVRAKKRRPDVFT